MPGLSHLHGRLAFVDWFDVSCFRPAMRSLNSDIFTFLSPNRIIFTYHYSSLCYDEWAAKRDHFLCRMSAPTKVDRAGNIRCIAGSVGERYGGVSKQKQMKYRHYTCFYCTSRECCLGSDE